MAAVRFCAADLHSASEIDRQTTIAIMAHEVKYLVITPVRDEEKHVEATIQAVTSQTILPREWIIVDDGSTDKTADIVKHYATLFPWIHLVSRPTGDPGNPVAA